jgi:hypothetical protein
MIFYHHCKERRQGLSIATASGGCGCFRFCRHRCPAWLPLPILPAGMAGGLWFRCCFITAFWSLPIISLERTRTTRQKMLSSRWPPIRFTGCCFFISVPVFWFSFLACAIAAGQPETPLLVYLGLALSSGISSGTAITVGHELGHKPNRLDQWGAKLANAVSGYGHFCIEHNRGHHVHVATRRKIPHRRGWAKACGALRSGKSRAPRCAAGEMEQARLERKGLSASGIGATTFSRAMQSPCWPPWR